MKKTMQELLFITLGTALFSFSVVFLASPVGLVTGGVSGVGIIIKELTGGSVPIYLTSLILNVPLFIIALSQRGLRFISKSLFAFIALTLFLGVLEAFPQTNLVEGDMPVSALLYGGGSGVGLGLVLRSSATSGGSDMLASIIKFKKPRFKISRLILIVDLAVILSGVFIFGLQKSVWALIALVVSTKTIDLTLTGVKNERVVFIISGRHEEIALDIKDTLKRGATLIEGVGSYTGEKRKILFTVITSREVALLKSMVSERDQSAFMTVSDAREVLGEGFLSIVKNKNSLA